MHSCAASSSFFFRLYLKPSLNIYATKCLGRGSSQKVALRTLVLFYQTNERFLLWVSPLVDRIARFNKEKNKMPSYF